MSRRILVVEDDADTRDYLAKALRESGYTVEASASGKDGLVHALTGGFDAMVLERMLPDLDGLSLLKAVRAAGSRTPAILLTAMSAIDERVSGLRAGADDYVVKPFTSAQLDARIRAVLRRVEAGRQRPSTITVGGLAVDLAGRRVHLDGTEVDLTPREFDLLAHLVERPGEVVTKRDLLVEVWRQPWGGSDKTVDVHLSWLRRKLGETAAAPRYLTTVRGVGVRLAAPVPDTPAPTEDD